MKRPPPPLNLIRSFECAARHLSFTKAAQELGYTQAAISTHVRALEKYVGRALFKRNARSLELTEIGEAFLPTLRQGLGQIDAATEAIQTGSKDRSVVLACPMSFAENWLPRLIDGFKATNPETEILIHGTVWEPSIDDIADIVISILRDDEVPENAIKLWPEQLMLLASPSIAARLRKPSDLRGFERILVSGRQEYWSIFDAALDMPPGEAHAPLKTNSSNISLELAAQGLGVTIALSSLGQVYLQRGLLAEPFQVRPPSPWSYYVTKRPTAKARAPKSLLDCLIGACSTVGPWATMAQPSG